MQPGDEGAEERKVRRTGAAERNRPGGVRQGDTDRQADRETEREIQTDRLTDRQRER
jgi:hypothetical protein